MDSPFRGSHSLVATSFSIFRSRTSASTLQIVAFHSKQILVHFTVKCHGYTIRIAKNSRYYFITLRKSKNCSKQMDSDCLAKTIDFHVRFFTINKKTPVLLFLNGSGGPLQYKAQFSTHQYHNYNTTLGKPHTIPF